MSSRALLAAILGAIAMFVWNFIAHTFLPLAHAGIREMPNEAAVISALQTNLGDGHGLYYFPGPGVGENATSEEKKEAMKRQAEKMASSPSGLLIYHPTRAFAFGRFLGVEFATELLQSILVVFLLVQARIDSFGGRVGFVFVAGILAAITTNISYWNWYGFSKRYTVAYMFIEIVGFLCVGIVAALVLKKRSSSAMA
jgi:hypothetical protein